MKKPFVAFFLSFLLPGAGLAYLGKWKWAIINLSVVLLIGVVTAVFLPEEFVDKYIRYIAVGCSSGSAGIAQQLAIQLNQKMKAESTT